jgi:hypothetical protein
MAELNTKPKQTPLRSGRSLSNSNKKYWIIRQARSPSRIVRDLLLSTRHTVRQTLVAVRGSLRTVFGAYLAIVLVILVGTQTCVASESNLLNAVTDFGADPTGIKDSTKQLQALFDQLPNGWQGFVPIGTYIVSSGLVIRSKTAIRIVGAAGGSFGSPVLSWTGAAGGTVITHVHSGIQQYA